jgi:transposase-like protein
LRLDLLDLDGAFSLRFVWLKGIDQSHGDVDSHRIIEDRFSAAQIEIERLKRELDRVRLQRDILKKSLGILPEGPLPKDMPK